MANRMELQNKGPGMHKNPDGKSVGPGTSHKGVSRTIRTHKHEEALDRDSHTHAERRRSYWRARGFRNESHARRVIADTVDDCNQQAADKKQRAADWPMLPENLIMDATA